jgi:hypothetical protein
MRSGGAGLKGSLRRRRLAALRADSTPLDSARRGTPSPQARRACCSTGAIRIAICFSSSIHRKRLFDAIDGRRSIAEIADLAPAAESGRARTLFERLWYYDQVVFDSSRAG